MKNSEINFSIQLDEKNIPENITWDATDNPSGKPVNTKAISLAIWDDVQFNTMRMDLWTKEMTVDEMKMFYVNAIGGMAQSLEEATGDTEMCKQIRSLCANLAKDFND